MQYINIYKYIWIPLTILKSLSEEIQKGKKTMSKLCCINPELLTLQIFLQQTVLHPSPNIYIMHLQSLGAITAILSGCKEKHQQIRPNGSIGTTASTCLCQICGGPPVKPVGCPALVHHEASASGLT